MKIILAVFLIFTFNIISAQNPTPPTNLQYEVQGNNVLLSWDAPEEIRDLLLNESFEGEAQPLGWEHIDNDGDGYIWTYYEFQAHTGTYSRGSESYHNEVGGGTALNPDNWLITPQLNLGNNSNLSFWIAPRSATYFAEHYDVLISTTGTEIENFDTTIISETFTIANNEWIHKEFDLSEFDNQTIYIAFVHRNSTDLFWILLDDVRAETNIEINYDLTAYKVYKNDQILSQIEQIENTMFMDLNVTGNNNEYYVTAIYNDEIESDPSNFVIVDMVNNNDQINTIHNQLKGQIYPNPFAFNSNSRKATSKISLEIPEEGYYSIKLFNLKGELQEVVFEGKLNQGNQTICLEQNKRTNSGIYFYRVESGKHTAVIKQVILN